ncbi:hypothetical protein FGIG_11879 [Fasciola gigantica]|uniref:Uncharacterized protein n=1 Tax=Fasciola gigantica TaxID=46835 RepID=A0A504YQ93_FASGI|nr:hypothetical protein FGIG_11879 [Fasciola gigantica]
MTEFGLRGDYSRREGNLKETFNAGNSYEIHGSYSNCHLMTTQNYHRSSFNRLTDFPDESTGENVDDDAEYNGTRILRILSGGLSRLTDSEDGVGTMAEKVTKARPHQDSTSTVLLTDGSTTTSGGDETHTSEDASVDTVKPAGASRDPSPASSSTTSASEGSEDIEPFPSPPPEIALMDPYQRCSSSPPSHSHLVISAGLDEVIEEEAGTSEMESETAAVAAAIAFFLDAATTDSNDEYGKKEEQKDTKDEGKGEEEEEEEEDEETSNATVIARDTTEPHCMEEITITDGSDDTTRPNSLPELNEYVDESEDEKTPTEIDRPVENLIPQTEAGQLDDQASAVSKDEVQEEATTEELSGKETEARCTVEVEYECAQPSEATLFETAAEEQENIHTQMGDECVHLDDPPQEDDEDMSTKEDKPLNECHLGEDPQETAGQREVKEEVVLTKFAPDDWCPGKSTKD